MEISQRENARTVSVKDAVWEVVPVVLVVAVMVGVLV